MRFRPTLPARSGAWSRVAQSCRGAWRQRPRCQQLSARSLGETGPSCESLPTSSGLPWRGPRLVSRNCIQTRKQGECVPASEGQLPTKEMGSPNPGTQMQPPLETVSAEVTKSR